MEGRLGSWYLGLCMLLLSSDGLLHVGVYVVTVIVVVVWFGTCGCVCCYCCGGGLVWYLGLCMLLLLLLCGGLLPGVVYVIVVFIVW